eukprot:m.84418 g.84418  ORF g.84418 m.84418 type:complete len:409 (+) comp25749_c0_seq3:256-1482(+)
MTLLTGKLQLPIVAIYTIAVFATGRLYGSLSTERKPCQTLEAQLNEVPKTNSFDVTHCPHCPDCEPCASPRTNPHPNCPELPKAKDSSMTCKEPTLKNFRESMRTLCDVALKDPDVAVNSIAVAVYAFCVAHNAQFKRDYDYGWDNVNANFTGYYRGRSMPPYQMSVLQYFGIITTIASIPHPTNIDKNFVDNFKNYLDIPEPDGTLNPFVGEGRRGSEGPRTLIWGCGADTPLYVSLTKFLGGSIAFVDDNKDWGDQCKRMGASELYIVKTTNDRFWHSSRMAQASQIGLDTQVDTPIDTLSEAEILPLPTQLLQGKPFDVILVDGPSAEKGRTQPIYTALRLAQSYPSNHYTHIFVHDAARGEMVAAVNRILGHNPEWYLGNYLPRKGLKHWRIPGKQRPFEPPPL